MWACSCWARDVELEPHETVNLAGIFIGGHFVVVPEAGRISLWRADAHEDERDFSARPGGAVRGRGRAREPVPAAVLLAKRSRLLGERPADRRAPFRRNRVR